MKLDLGKIFGELVWNLLKSKKFKAYLVGVFATFLVAKKVVSSEMAPEIANKVFDGINYLSIAVIGSQGISDGFSGGATSSSK